MLGVFLDFLFFNFGNNNKQAKLTFSYMNSQDLQKNNKIKTFYVTYCQN